MKLKLDDAGHVVVQDGKPVYTDDKGVDQAFDVAAALAKITSLNGEAKGHREAKEAAEGRLKQFEGIDDPEGARKALETVKNLDQGQLMTAGKVEELKNGLRQTLESQHKATVDQLRTANGTMEKQLAEITERYNGEKVTNAFSGSKFINEKVATPLDMFQSMFSRQFKIEDGRLVGYHASGAPIMNMQGEHAGFDEAIEQIVAAYPHKDRILKGTQSSGGGARPFNGSGGGSRRMLKTQFDAMDPRAQADLMSSKDRPEIVETL